MSQPQHPLTPAPRPKKTLADWRKQLCYCTNVHPSETYDELMQVVTHHAPTVRNILGRDNLNIGLYISNRTSVEMTEQPDRFDALRRALDDNRLFVTTLNGFPYGDFHAERVKEQVYKPDWHDPQRLDYTLRIARLLTQLIPKGATGAISTLPYGLPERWDWDGGHSDPRHVNVARAAGQLSELAVDTGTRVVVCLEPEPGLELSSSYWAGGLLGESALAGEKQHVLSGLLPGDPTANDAIVRRHVGVCFDCCHDAVMDLSPGRSLARLWSEGAHIGKIQLSSALEVRSNAAFLKLKEFDEPKYLHQTYIASASASPNEHAGGYRSDISVALAEEPLLGTITLARSHFHVPIYWDEPGDFGSTQKELIKAIAAIKELQLDCPLEIETYTWSVLPKELQAPTLHEGIAREFHWAEEQLAKD
jgi:sugar phosphate isomerase/epimerase